MNKFGFGVKIQEYVDIKNYSTFKIGGQFRYFIKVLDKNELNNIYKLAKEKNIPIFVLGGGSNVIFSDGIINIFVLKIEIKDFEIINETNKYVDIKIGAGEIWDKVVEKTVKMGFSGFEALSAIPGTVGATPVQNVGAYGAEVKDIILNVEVFDTKPARPHEVSGVGGDNKIKNILNKDCKFGYRDSIFKNEAKGKYIIISVTYRLLKNFVKIPDYSGVKKYLIENNIKNPTLKQIRQSIINIRKDKLPNPKEIPNVGSFFKNPIVSKESFLVISKAYDSHDCISPTGTSVEIPHFDMRDGMTKIPAGWLIEKAGLKGKPFGKISVYKNNALVLINNGGATKEDVIKAKNKIIKIVQEKFGIILEQEPEMI